jgi:hypothetical protein
MLFYIGLFCAALLVRGADKRRRRRPRGQRRELEGQ